MKLKDLLPVITHQNYQIYVQNPVTMLLGEPLKLESIEDIQAHFDYEVLGMDEAWNIMLKGEKLV